MHAFFETICPVGVWVFVAFHVASIAVFVINYVKTKKPEYLLCAFESFGLFFDSLIIALGVFLPESEGLKNVSQVRFVSHGLLIPLLFAITSFHLKCKKPFNYILLGLTAALMIAGAIEGFATILEVKEVAGVVRYAASKSTPAWASGISSLLSYGAVLPLIVGGIIDIIKKKNCLFLLSGVLMFAFSALGPATGCADLIFFISMFGEALMMLFIFLSIKKVVRE